MKAQEGKYLYVVGKGNMTENCKIYFENFAGEH